MTQPKFVRDRRLWGREVLFATVYIEVDTPNGAIAKGTGFLVNAQRSGEEDTTFAPALITNRHVAVAGASGRIRFIRSNDGEPDLGAFVTVSFVASDWFFHSDLDVDLALMSMGAPLNELKQVGTPAFFTLLLDELFPTAEELELLDVIEPVAFIGYPIGLFDSVNLTPIARRGSTATPVQLNFDGKQTFLIDASVFPGSSGSPVLVVHEGGYRTAKGFKLGVTRLIFVGVVSSVFHYAAPGNMVSSPLTEVTFSQMIDLAVVTKWTAVEELINQWATTVGLDRSLPAASP